MRKILAGLLATACVLCTPGAVAGQGEMSFLIDEAHQLAAQLADRLRGEVARELEHGGPLSAILVCKYSAPEITATISRQSGARVTRVALKPRNRATGEPDAWEQRILLGFEKRVSKGENVAELEHTEIVQEPHGRYFRYMKAIPMTGACAGCHGSNISKAVKALLAAEYPHDKAVNIGNGQVRGAISIKKQL